MILLFCTLFLISGCQQSDQSETETGTGGLSSEGLTSETPKESKLKAYFLDVGQGSAAVYETEGHFLLVDGGDRSTSSYVVSYLKNLGVESLDYCIATHYDADHISGLVGCLNVFPVDCVIAPEYEADSKIYDSFKKMVKNQNLTITAPVVGESYSFGEGSFTILSPKDTQYSDENDYSVGIRLVFGDTSFISAGDASALSEYEMLESGLELKSDVYVVNHHGSETSSSEGFLKAVSPSYAIISCGLNNSYGHPAKQTMDRLKALDIELFRTDLQGTLTAESDGKTISFLTEAAGDYTAGEAGIEEGQTADYILNTITMVFHRPDCSSVSTMNEKNKQEFYGTREEAEQLGYRACKRCL